MQKYLTFQKSAHFKIFTVECLSGNFKIRPVRNDTVTVGQQYTNWYGNNDLPYILDYQ